MRLYTHTHGISLIVIIITIVIIATGNTVYANFQSRPGTNIYYTGSADTHFVNIRKMESASGSLGLSATIDANGNETSASNNIDAHMMKQTEFGIVVTHINSQYGVKYANITKRSDRSDTVNDYTKAYSTTLNMSGIMGIGSYYNYSLSSTNNRYLFVASASALQSNLSNTTVFKTVKSRYINLYSTTKKSGDGVEYFNNDIFNSTAISIFSGTSYMSSYKSSSYYNNSSYAVIVNGIGV